MKSLPHDLIMKLYTEQIHLVQGPISQMIFPSIQILGKIRFSMTPLWDKKSLRNFAHITTAQISYHVQSFIVITSLHLVWQQNDISIEYELRWKNCLWNGPPNTLPMSSCLRVSTSSTMCAGTSASRTSSLRTEGRQGGMDWLLDKQTDGLIEWLIEWLTEWWLNDW